MLFGILDDENTGQVNTNKWPVWIRRRSIGGQHGKGPHHAMSLASACPTLGFSMSWLVCIPGGATYQLKLSV